MNFKLRKTSKLNIFVAVFMCVLLLFCFCSTSYVQAADSLGDHYKDYVTFKSELAHTGYMSYFDHNNWIYNKDFKVGRDLSLSILSTDIPKWSNSSYKVSTSWKAFTSSVSGSYDVYCLFGANYDITYGSSTPLVFYFIVPSGSRICWGKDMAYSPSESMWQQSYFNVVTDASGIFCVRFRSVADKISAWSYGYCVKNGSSMSCDNKRAVLPALGNEFIVLLKDTSLITVIGGKELLYAAQGIMNRTYEPMFPLLGVAATYLVLVMLFSALLAKFERRLAQSDRR